MVPSCVSVILASLLLFNFVGPRDVTSAFPWHPNKLCFVVFSSAFLSPTTYKLYKTKWRHEI